ncbi:tRNA dimethylallyltransferase [Homalodisca vitripennis]|nr:tRNA dimethylallyltransferase [Homalodisca vitripennis]
MHLCKSNISWFPQHLCQIEDLLERRKLPVVAGGTCYYVEALLWKLLMPVPEYEGPPPKRARNATSDGSVGSGPVQCEGVRGVMGRVGDILAGKGIVGNVVKGAVEELSADDKAELHNTLKEVDPERALELHPNNVRKVIRLVDCEIQFSCVR